MTADLPDGKTQVSEKTVVRVNNAPALQEPRSVKAIVGEPLQRRLGGASDADGDAVTFELESGPAGLELDEDGVLTWAAPVDGAYEVVYHVNDGKLDSPARALQVTVAAQGSAGDDEDSGGGAFGLESLLLLSGAAVAGMRLRRR
ncbi:MAG: Ig-like domain-containing protein [Comamonadaceae bacterium]|nr:Ig-like domain-containing protein [Comamonadaceae bacterium]